MKYPPPAEHSQRVTMRMVAERADVHISTVSRILGVEGGKRRLSPVGQRVLAVAEELGYIPDPYAASLRTQRTKMLGVLVPRLTDIVVSTIYEGIEKAATELGYQTVVSQTLDVLSEHRRRVDGLIGRRVDGLIVADAHLDGVIPDDLARRAIPFVLVSRHAGDHLAVTGDDWLGGRLVGTHLADLGHRNIGIVAGLSFASTGRDRAGGCIEALRERGISVPKSLIVSNGFDAAAGREAGNLLLQKNPRPTAIFAVNDFAALGVMGALRDHGLRVGEDVAVVGYNDISIAADFPVPLTTVRSPMLEMGVVAAQTLVALLQGKKVTSTKLPTQLVVRQSSLSL